MAGNGGFSDEAARLLNGGSTLVAPELVFAEAANTLWAMRRRGDIAPADMMETPRRHPV